MMQLIAYDPAAQGPAYIAALEAAGLSAVLRPDGLYVSDIDAAQAVAADAAALLVQAKAIKAAAVASCYAGKIAAGFNYAGKLIQIDDASQANIAAQGLAALGSIVDPASNPWDANFTWICADNSRLALATAAAMYAFATACDGYVKGCILQRRALKDAIAGATTLAALQAIDISTGWPA
jgi:hypothetical protein